MCVFVVRLLVLKLAGRGGFYVPSSSMCTCRSRQHAEPSGSFTGLAAAGRLPEALLCVYEIPYCVCYDVPRCVCYDVPHCVCYEMPHRVCYDVPHRVCL